ncbi:hypothetical protein [Piscinibacter sakaiensis]
MRLALAMLLGIPGLLLLANPRLLPLGLALCWAAWWVYERSSLRASDALMGAVLLLGGLGAAVVAGQGLWQVIAGP